MNDSLSHATVLIMVMMRRAVTVFTGSCPTESSRLSSISSNLAAVAVNCQDFAGQATSCYAASYKRQNANYCARSDSKAYLTKLATSHHADTSNQ